MVPEIGFWKWLISDASATGRSGLGDHGNLLLRQRIPELCLFNGNELEAWYSTNDKGFATRRRKDVTLEAMLDYFLWSASVVAPLCPGSDGSRLSPDSSANVAILRREGSEAGGGTWPDGVPIAMVLSAQELMAVVNGLAAGVAPADGMWSLQAMVWPDDDLRCVSVYSRDVAGAEKSEIFARRFGTYYRQTDAVDLPQPSSVAADKCIALSASRREALEARTLGVIRYASRMHGVELEGMTLEFIFDAQGRPVLHGCWCATTASNVANPGGAGRRIDSGRMFPVPVVADRDKDRAGYEQRERVPLPQGAAYNNASVFEADASVEEKRFEDTSILDPCEMNRVLLEMWSGDEFLGEAWVPLRTKTCPEEQDMLVWEELHLHGMGEAGRLTRVDSRKSHAVPLITVAAGVDVCFTRDGHSALRFGPARANGLPLVGHLRPRLLLWLRRDALDQPLRDGEARAGDFVPLWGSREAPHANAPSWDETVVLPLGLLGPDLQHRPGSASRLEFARSSKSSVERPDSARSARGLLEGGRSVSPSPSARLFASVSEAAAAAKDQGDPVCPASGSRAKLQWPPASMERSVPSAQSNIAGAHLSAHWGMSEDDGSMRTHLLAEQSKIRLSARGYHNGLLDRLSEQLLSFHDMELRWSDEHDTAEDAVARDNKEIEDQRVRLRVVQEESERMAEVERRKLAAFCKELCEPIDQHRLQEHADAEKLDNTRGRLEEQRGMVHRLVDHSHALQESLDKTVRKYDEINTTHAALREEIAETQTKHSGLQNPGMGGIFGGDAAAPELGAASQQVSSMGSELETDKQELLALKAHCARLQNEMAGERQLSLRLEDFVRKIACAPSSTVRTGGGFALDSAAKHEASALIQAAEAGQPLPPPPGRSVPTLAPQEVEARGAYDRGPDDDGSLGEASGKDEVHQEDFKYYADDLSNYLSNNSEPAKSQIRDFLMEQGLPLPDKYRVKSPIIEFLLEQRKQVVDITIIRNGFVLSVSFKSRPKR